LFRVPNTIAQLQWTLACFSRCSITAKRISIDRDKAIADKSHLSFQPHMLNFISAVVFVVVLVQNFYLYPKIRVSVAWLFSITSLKVSNKITQLERALARFPIVRSAAERIVVNAIKTITYKSDVSLLPLFAKVILCAIGLLVSPIVP